MGPLSGIKIVEFSDHWTFPSAQYFSFFRYLTFKKSVLFQGATQSSVDTLLAKQIGIVIRDRLTQGNAALIMQSELLAPHEESRAVA